MQLVRKLEKYCVFSEAGCGDLTQELPSPQITVTVAEDTADALTMARFVIIAELLTSRLFVSPVICLHAGASVTPALVNQKSTSKPQLLTFTVCLQGPMARTCLWTLSV